MSIRILGIVCDNYKVPTYLDAIKKEELKFTVKKDHPVECGTSILIECKERDTPSVIQKVMCIIKKLEAYFKAKSN